MTNNRHVLILGGGGFIGSHIAESLLGSHAVRIFDKKNFSPRNIRAFEREVEVVEGDFSNRHDVEHALSGIDCVYHAVCSTLPAMSNVNCTYDVETNVIPTVNLLEALRHKKQVRLIFISSGGTVYGEGPRIPIGEDDNTNPHCSYGITKLMIEKYIALYGRLYGINYIIARLSNPYGERQAWNYNQGLIVTMLHSIIANRPIEIWGDGSVVRDYIYIKDAVAALARMESYGGQERIFNVACGHGLSINQVLQKIIAVTGQSPAVIYKANRTCDVQANVLDISRAARELSWRPQTTIEEGIALVYRFLSMSKSNATA